MVGVLSVESWIRVLIPSVLETALYWRSKNLTCISPSTQWVLSDIRVRTPDLWLCSALSSRLRRRYLSSYYIKMTCCPLCPDLPRQTG
ncbi:hypothetical protein TNCV_1794711 [Trichonephila clavipes]|nr:hypothetical protein TNCV_1794711 [Trichonephila clavipes]